MPLAQTVFRESTLTTFFYKPIPAFENHEIEVYRKLFHFNHITFHPKFQNNEFVDFFIHFSIFLSITHTLTVTQPAIFMFSFCFVFVLKFVYALMGTFSNWSRGSDSGF